MRNHIYRAILVDALVSNGFHHLFPQRGAYASVTNAECALKGSLSILWASKQINKEAISEFNLLLEQVFGVKMAIEGN
jgi:hypothetical protein